MTTQVTLSKNKRLTYIQPNIVDYTLDDNLQLHQQVQVDTWIYNPPQTNLGNLNALPLELLSVVFSKLDLESLMNFRQINRLAFELVNQNPEFTAIRKHAWDALKSILQTHNSGCITSTTLYNQLCTAECEICGDFGGYLYILTCSRVCFLCFTEDKRYLPLSFRRAQQKYGITSRAIRKLPHMKTVPGVYSPNQKRICRRIDVVDAESARRAGEALHGSMDALERYVANDNQQRLLRYESRKSLSTLPGSRAPRRPQIEDGHDGLSGNPLRFVAIVRMPWFDRSKQVVEWGFHCLACEKSYHGRPLNWRRKFGRTSFLKHIEQYGLFRDGKHDPSQIVI